MNILTWNLEWAPPSSRRTTLIQEQVSRIDPAVVCYTEIKRGFISNGHAIAAGPDYGYPHKGDRRKVLLWSKSSWADVDLVGDPDLPSGRFVSGITQGIRFMGVCIPWRDAHVRTGRKNRTPWEDHLTYCQGLGRILQRYRSSPEPICVLGDYNQRVPRTRQPKEVAQALLDAIPKDFSIVTEDVIDAEGNPLIDHVAVSGGLSAKEVKILPKVASDGTKLSDHVGVIADLEIGSERQTVN